MRVSQWNIRVSAKAEAPQICQFFFHGPPLFLLTNRSLSPSCHVRGKVSEASARRLWLFVFFAIRSCYSLKPGECHLTYAEALNRSPHIKESWSQLTDRITPLDCSHTKRSRNHLPVLSIHVICPVQSRQSFRWTPRYLQDWVISDWFHMHPEKLKIQHSFLCFADI